MTGLARSSRNLSSVAQLGIFRRRRPSVWHAAFVVVLAVAVGFAVVGLGGFTDQAPPSSPAAAGGIHKIRHVVIIMQENRSFDSFFGTYPGADGIPAKNGRFTVCVPDPRRNGCDRPYHDPSLVNGGGGHSHDDARTDINGGKMNGFVRTAELAASRGCSATYPTPRVCLPSGPPDVMGYHDAREIPNYWTYARDFTLNDHMFEPVASWSLPAHLYLVSGWAAECKNANPYSCTQLPRRADRAARQPRQWRHQQPQPHGQPQPSSSLRRVLGLRARSRRQSG